MNMNKMAKAGTKGTQGWDLSSGKAMEAPNEATYGAKFTLALESGAHVRFAEWLMDLRKASKLSAKKVNMTSAIRVAVDLIVEDGEFAAEVKRRLRSRDV